MYQPVPPPLVYTVASENAVWRGRRLMLAALALAVAFAVVPSGLRVVANAAASIGFQDQSYSGVPNPPTSDKPQSKLWWNDGSWWADMFNATSKTWDIYRLDRTVEQWVDTGVVIDNRVNTLADCLWDGTHLYVASHVVSVSTDGSPVASGAGNPALLYRFSYAGGAYTLDQGFPATIENNSSESMTIDKDSTGELWATWTQVSAPSGKTGWTNAVYVTHTVGSDGVWATPYVLPVSGANPAPDDISAVVAYGQNKIGVMWSNQNDGTFYWAVHVDGNDPGSGAVRWHCTASSCPMTTST